VEKKIIAIIDDCEEHCLFVRSVLSSRGFIVKSINSGLVAIQKIMETPPHLILLDIMMPEINGFQILEDIKKIDFLKPVPVIMFSSLNTLDKVNRAVAMGAYGYILKPIKTSLMIEKVNQALAERPSTASPVKLNPSDSKNTTEIKINAKISGFNKNLLSINSELIISKNIEVKLVSDFFNRAKIGRPSLTSFKNSSVAGKRYRYQNEFLMSGLSKEDTESLRQWMQLNSTSD